VISMRIVEPHKVPTFAVDRNRIPVTNTAASRSPKGEYAIFWTAFPDRLFVRAISSTILPGNVRDGRDQVRRGFRGGPRAQQPRGFHAAA
jgi:hypothetical protein